MKKNTRNACIYAVLTIFFIELLKRIPILTSFYISHIYPRILPILNFISSLFPFSLYDVFIVMTIGWLIWKFIGLFSRSRRLMSVRQLMIGGATLYAAFYLLWGINYFAPGFYERTGLHPASYSSHQFNYFLESYIEKLNASYLRPQKVTDSILRAEIRRGYEMLPKELKRIPIPDYYHEKQMLLSKLYASMGIKGYYGPFFAETHLNGKLLDHQYPFTLAHETAHLTGVTSEAEANLIGYLITTTSNNPQVRFSGYYSLLPYVLRNASVVLSEDEYRKTVSQINPEIRALFEQTSDYWSSLYSRPLGKVQDFFYDFYLKGNNIPTGMQNYSEVIGMLVALQEKNRQERIRLSLNRQLKNYSSCTLQDLYKSFFQDYFGPAHMGLTDEVIRRGIEQELVTMKQSSGYYYEPVGEWGNYIRVDLSVVRDSILPFETYYNAFRQSIRECPKRDVKEWCDEWAFIESVLHEKKYRIQFYEEDSTLIHENLEKGIFVSHHSTVFLENYDPHYRIIRKDIFEERIFPYLRKSCPAF